jgi:hypothetical protein
MRAIALDDQTPLDTTTPECHRKKARNDQLLCIRRGPLDPLRYRHLQRYADAGIGQVYAIDQGIEGAPASTSDCRRSLHAAAAEKSDGSQWSARPIA